MKKDIIQGLEATMQKIKAAFRISNAQILDKRPAPGKWSKKEILGHLVDSACRNLQRFQDVQTTAEPYKIITYDQDALVKINNYQNQPKEEVVRLFLALNQQIIEVMKEMEEAVLKQTILFPDDEQRDVFFLVSDYLRHMNHHGDKILENLEVNESYDLFQVQLTKAKAILANQKDQRFVKLMERGTLEIELYEPHQIDPQQPHLKDEIYIVNQGKGTYIVGPKKFEFHSGDVLFAPAGEVHRFENFSEDFSCWVIFYGPKNGE